MFETLHITSRYEIIEESGAGRRYLFYCELSDRPVYATGSIRADTPEEALQLAWEEAQYHFNGCSACGKWVCDDAYNRDEMKCVACAPRTYRR